MTRYILGIDEAGRGPLAGPVAVGFFCAGSEVVEKFADIKDSKKLSEVKREEYFTKIKDMKESGEARSVVMFGSASDIDKFGIAKVIRKAIALGLKKMSIDANETEVLLDGLLKAPEEYLNQKTIIKGDEKEPVIALASIVAKVARDRKMVALATEDTYKKYGFEIHKGYGTKMHMEKILEYGLSAEHRRTFCGNVIGKIHSSSSYS